MTSDIFAFSFLRFGEFELRSSLYLFIGENTHCVSSFFFIVLIFKPSPRNTKPEFCDSGRFSDLDRLVICPEKKVRVNFRWRRRERRKNETKK